MEYFSRIGREALGSYYLSFQDDSPASSGYADLPNPNRGPEEEQLFETISISRENGPGGAGSTGLVPRPLSALEAFFSESGTDGAAPQLKLICIDSSDRGLRIPKRIFTQLCVASKINPSVFSILSSGIGGLHYIKADGKNADTYVLGSLGFRPIFWTFDRATACSKVLSLRWADLENKDRISAQSHALLNDLRPYLGTPYVPLMADTLDRMQHAEAALQRRTADVLKVELDTGFAHWADFYRKVDFEIESLGRWSWRCAQARIEIIEGISLHETDMRALDIVEEACRMAMARFSDHAVTERFDESVAALADVVAVVKMRGEAYKRRAKFVAEQAQSQINIIFALLTHADSVSNLRAAEASIATANAMKQDSSALKTLAFLTMAFLPPTFLATLFALPAFEWNHKVDVQINGILLYWAVAIPGTAVVFAVWALVTHRTWIIDRVLSHRKKTQRPPGGISAQLLQSR